MIKKGEAGYIGAYRDLVDMGPHGFMQHIATMPNAKLCSTIDSLLYWQHTEEWYYIFQCVLLLRMRKYTHETVYLHIRNAFQRHYRFVRPTRQFIHNISVATAYLAASGITCEYFKHISFGTICMITNALHILPFDTIMQMLNSVITPEQVFEEVKKYAKGIERKYAYVDRSPKQVERVCKFSQGEHIFIEEMYKRYLAENEHSDNVPFENFVVACVQLYKNAARKPTKKMLKDLFLQCKPDTLLQVFSEVYPDITLIAQYPYVR